MQQLLSIKVLSSISGAFLSENVFFFTVTTFLLVKIHSDERYNSVTNLIEIMFEFNRENEGVWHQQISGLPCSNTIH